MQASESPDFIYLVQGQSSLVKNYLHLLERPRCTALFLTYDEPLEGTEYFPNSTWAEGRNRLLELALSKYREFKYIIFADDDVEFYHGSWNEFEQGLHEYNPMIAVPVFDRTSTRVLPYPFFQVQSFTYNDEQLMAFSHQVVTERLVLPYETRFDSLHWWATCRLQQILIQNYYQGKILQFNFVRVSNMEHDRYSFNNNSEDSYRHDVIDWVRSNHNRAFSDINKTPSKFELFVKSLKTFGKLNRRSAFSSFGPARSTLKKSSVFSKSIKQETLLKQIDGSSNWVIYGYGEIGQKLYQQLKHCEKSEAIHCIVDRKAAEGEFEVDGVTVHSPKKIIETDNVKVVIASYSFIHQIEFYLKFQLGLMANQIIRIIN